VSLIAPVLMLIIAVLDFAVAVRGAVHQAVLAAVPVWQLLSFVPFVGGPAAVMIGWLAVVVLGLTGRRRTAAAIAVAVVVTRVPGAVNWRVAVLVATGLLLYLANTFPLIGDLTATVVLRLGSVLFAVLVWPVAIASWRGRVGRASRAG
jgi:hypothetical protein